MHLDHRRTACRNRWYEFSNYSWPSSSGFLRRIPGDMELIELCPCFYSHNNKALPPWSFLSIPLLELKIKTRSFYSKNVCTHAMFLGQFNTNPGRSHLVVAKRLLRFVAGTVDLAFSVNQSLVISQFDWWLNFWDGITGSHESLMQFSCSSPAWIKSDQLHGQVFDARS